MAREGITSKHGSHARQRRFPGARGRAPQNRELRQREARERQEAWQALSPKEQLALLSKQPGVSAKQVARVKAKLDAEEPKATKRSGR